MRVSVAAVAVAGRSPLMFAGGPYSQRRRVCLSFAVVVLAVVVLTPRAAGATVRARERGVVFS